MKITVEKSDPLAEAIFAATADRQDVNIMVYANSGADYKRLVAAKLHSWSLVDRCPEHRTVMETQWVLAPSHELGVAS